MLYISEKKNTKSGHLKKKKSEKFGLYEWMRGGRTRLRKQEGTAEVLEAGLLQSQHRHLVNTHLPLLLLRKTVTNQPTPGLSAMTEVPGESTHLLSLYHMFLDTKCHHDYTMGVFSNGH